MVDVDREALFKALEGINNLDEEFYTGVVLPTGDQYVVNGSKETVFDFTQTDAYIKGTEESGMFDTEIDGAKYLYAYSEIGSTGMKLCTLIPYSNIMREAYQIRNLTIVIVIVATILALVVGISMSVGITKSVKLTGKALKTIASGDFSGYLRINTKDEFEELAEDINDMMKNVSQLIIAVKNVGLGVTTSSQNVNTDAEDMLHGMLSIHEAISEIEEGVTGQAGDAQSCLEQMSDLSDSILNMREGVDAVTIASAGTRKMIAGGISTMSRLSAESEKQMR